MEVEDVTCNSLRLENLLIPVCCIETYLAWGLYTARTRGMQFIGPLTIKVNI